MAYTPIGWLNGQAPAINQTNLNKMDEEIYRLGVDGDKFDATIDRELGYTEDETDSINAHLEYLLKNPKNIVDIKTNAMFTKLVNTSANVGGHGITLDSNTSYDTYYFVATQKMTMYFRAVTFTNYTAICFGKNSDISSMTSTLIPCVGAVRKRSTENNLPIISAPLEVEIGDVIAITLLSNQTELVNYNAIENKFSKQLGGELSALAFDVQENANGLSVVVKAEGKGTDIKTFSGFQKVSGTSVSVDGRKGLTLDTNASYDSYYWEVPCDLDLYFASASSTTYLAFAFGNNFNKLDGNTLFCDSPTRKRGSENNLPTSSSKKSVHYGDVIVFTVPASGTNTVYGIEKSYSFSDALAAALVTPKKPQVIYDNTASGTETERLYIYIPAGVGYIRYNFAHAVSVQNNYDIWLVHPLYAVADDLSERFALTTSGEFECALKIAGASDFMGGSEHGDEKINSIEFFIDGKKVSPSSISAIQTFKELRIVENSNLYNPADGTTLAAIHGKEYIFTENGMTITQRVIWKGNYTMDYSYLAMLPVLKTVTDYVILDTDFEPKAFSDGYFNKLGSESAQSYKESIGFSVKMSIPKWDMQGTSLTNVGQFRCTDNGGRNYNKQYYVCTGGGTVANNNVWKSKTVYEFELNA